MKERVKKIVAEFTNCELVNDDTHLINDLGVDSLSFVELIIRIEDELGIQINPNDMLLENLLTVEKLSAVFEKNKSPGERF